MLVVPICVIGQTKKQIVGKVNDQLSSSPLPYATVSLIQLPDTILASGTVTDTTGAFILEAPVLGSYIVEISYLGYQHYMSKPFELLSESQDIDLGNVSLANNTNQLKELTIIGTKSFIERQDDKLVVNVESSVVGAGASAIEVLERSPGVFLSGSGLSVQGKPAMVMLDGKQIQLEGASLSDFLNNLRSESITKIELITQPSAKYDATAGAIINIITKKGSQNGFNSTLNASLGRSQFNKYGVGGSFNYRKRIMNIYGSYNYQDNESMVKREENSLFTEPSLLELRTSTHNDISSQSHAPTLGIDLNISSGHTIGFVANGSFSNSNSRGISNTGFSGDLVTVDSTLQTPKKSNNQHEFYLYNLYYQGTLDSLGKTISVSVNYGRDFYESSSIFVGYMSTPEWEELRFVEGLQNMPNYKIQFNTYDINYISPFRSGLALEVGVRQSLAKTANNLLINLQSEEEGLWRADASQSNKFEYNERISAGYISLQKSIGAWDVGGGLRGEYTFAEINSLTNNELIKRDYFNLFPNLSVKNTINENHQVSFAFRGGIRRPNYSNLNPFILYTNQYTYYQGNPYLNPEKSYDLSLIHNFKNVSTTFSYIVSRDLFYETFEQFPETGVTRHFFNNLARGTSYDINVNFPLQFSSWWESSNNIYATYGRIQDSEFLGLNLDEISYGVYANTSHQLSLTNSIRIDMTATYIGMFRYATTLQLPNFYANIGLQKNLLNDIGSLRINFNDVFWSRKYRYETISPNQNQQGNNYRDTRLIRLTFSYNLGNRKMKARQQRSQNLEEVGRSVNN